MPPSIRAATPVPAPGEPTMPAIGGLPQSVLHAEGPAQRSACEHAKALVAGASAARASTRKRTGVPDIVSKIRLGAPVREAEGRIRAPVGAAAP